MLGDELNLFRSWLEGPLAFLILLPVPPVLGGDIGWEDELENQLSGYHPAGHHDPRSLMAGGPGGQSVAGGPGVVECDWPGRLLFRSCSSITMSRLGLDWSMISSLLSWSLSIWSSSVMTGRVENFNSKLCITSSVEVMKVASSSIWRKNISSAKAEATMAAPAGMAISAT